MSRKRFKVGDPVYVFCVDATLSPPSDLKVGEVGVAGRVVGERGSRYVVAKERPKYGPLRGPRRVVAAASEMKLANDDKPRLPNEYLVYQNAQRNDQRLVARLANLTEAKTWVEKNADPGRSTTTKIEGPTGHYEYRLWYGQTGEALTWFERTKAALLAEYRELKREEAKQAATDKRLERHFGAEVESSQDLLGLVLYEGPVALRFEPTRLDANDLAAPLGRRSDGWDIVAFRYDSDAPTYEDWLPKGKALRLHGELPKTHKVRPLIAAMIKAYDREENSEKKHQTLERYAAKINQRLGVTNAAVRKAKEAWNRLWDRCINGI